MIKIIISFLILYDKLMHRFSKSIF